MLTEKVDVLVSPGKTYNIFYKGRKLINLTLESNKELNPRQAYEIIQRTAKELGVNPQKIKKEYVTFKEGEVEL